MKILPIGASCVAMLLATTLGCTSPLKSSDPAVRARAVAELSDDKELFFIAMNVGVYIGQKSGSYYNAFLTEEHYLDDVRVAAVNRLSGIDWILNVADGKALGAEAVKKVRHNYATQQVMVRYIEVYQQVLAQTHLKL